MEGAYASGQAATPKHAMLKSQNKPLNMAS